MHECLGRVRASGVPSQSDLEVVLADGSKRWLTAQWEPVRGHDGTIERIRATLTDCKLARLALQEAETKLRLVVENAPAAIAMLDRQLRYIEVSKRWKQDYELGDRDLRGRSHFEIFPEIPEHLRQVLRRCLAGETVRSDEDAFTRTDGRPLWVRWEIQPWRKFDDSIGGIIISSELITKQKETELALRSSEERLSLVQHAAGMGVFDVEFLSGKGTWSPKLFEILGLPPDFQPRTSEDLTRLIHPEDRSLLDRMMVEMIDGKPVNHEFRVYRPDGEMRWVDVCGQRKADDSGESIRFVGTCVDITGRKREEQEKQRSAQRFRALAARLQRIREEERTRAAREIHDELGQAMTAIKMDLGRLIRDLHPAQQDAFLPVLHTADQAVDSVRRIARELRPGILDASGLVGAVEWAASEFTTRTGIKCHVNLPSDEIQMHPEVTTALFRILQEALTNVARHSEAMEAHVTLADEEDRVVMEIHDDGKGISNEMIGAADSLGILGMRERALLLGGELQIHGAPAEGTTLRILLPKAATSRLRAPR